MRPTIRPPRVLKPPITTNVKAQRVKHPQPAGVQPAIPRTVKAKVPRPIGALPKISSAQKKANVEKKAITAARNKLYRMGFTSVRQMQHNKIHGVDLGAFKYSRDGKKLLNSAVIEVKGRSGVRPGPAAFKKQVRMSYIKPRLEKAASKGVKGADALLRKAKQGKLQSYGATYSLKDKGKGPNIYKVPKRGPISSKPIATPKKG